MKRLLFLALLLTIAIATRAENYPYRSDVLWVTVPDHADWLYQTGEKATVEVQLYKYGIARACTIEYDLADDLQKADHHGKATLKDGRAVIEIGTRKKPGFRDLRLTAKLDGQTYRHHVKVGFGVDGIRPVTQRPDDFARFWETARQEAARFPLRYTAEPYAPFSDEEVETQLLRIELDNQHHAFYAFLMKPRGAKPGSCPVVLTPPGAGVKTIKQAYERSYFQKNGIIRLVIDIHGLNPTLPQSTFDDLSHAFGNYLEIGLESRDTYYMRHVYLGLIRCIDLLTSLPEWDGKNVATLGGSQGGALAIAAAALDSRVTLCVANHPALADMAAAATPGAAHGYPHFSPKQLTPQAIRTLSYYDITCFAPLVRAKTFLTWGYNDDVCPPTTSYAVWNLLTCPKESLVTPINEHWTSDATDRMQMEWLLKNFEKSK